MKLHYFVVLVFGENDWRMVNMIIDISISFYFAESEHQLF